MKHFRQKDYWMVLKFTTVCKLLRLTGLIKLGLRSLPSIKTDLNNLFVVITYINMNFFRQFSPQKK